MIFGIYAILDAKSCFMPCTPDTNDMTAVRNFKHAVNASGSLMAENPTDFALYKIGEMDDTIGELWPISPTKKLCDASQCLAKEVK